MKIYLHTAIGGWVKGVYENSWSSLGIGYACYVYNYPFGYYKVPSEFNNVLEACMGLPQSVYDMINGYPRPKVAIDGTLFDVDYVWPGLVTWSPDGGVYEINLSRTRKNGGYVSADDGKRAVYTGWEPLVMVSEEKREAAGLNLD